MNTRILLEQMGNVRIAVDPLARHATTLAQRLELLEKSQSQAVRSMVERIKGLVPRAERFPELMHDVKFLQALEHLHLHDMQRMVQAKERQAIYAAKPPQPENIRRSRRAEIEITNLKIQIIKLGGSVEEITVTEDGLDNLRELIRKARARQEIWQKAARYGCLLRVLPLTQVDDFEAAEVMIGLHERLIESAKKYGIEDAVRKHLLLGELAQARLAISDAEKRLDMEKFRCSRQARVDQVLPISRPKVQKLLDAVCALAYDSRQFRQAKKKLDRELHEFRV